MTLNANNLTKGIDNKRQFNFYSEEDSLKNLPYRQAGTLSTVYNLY